ncbi:DUF930 domain-containing protein [Phyllobacterium salinisoli]|uniref:DUF930 domain-containing protein n=1 Tax=Phyllobacterium salinisoli TaxID=1899321 RepID=A0A368K964_9HYPH|nr:DUF930 domain-containing protein [Phyllobacterium salinisoli]RCS24952.1 DUF930 domain-containing protein [Phyllobacterium salinisoli]
MKALLAAPFVLVWMVLPGLAMGSSVTAQLMKLDPATRLEQRCDVEAMERIRANPSRFSPDKVLAYAFAEPVVGPDSIRASGAAFRSAGKWFHLSFNCKTSPDHIKVLSFQFAIGSVIPEREWPQHYLVP